MPAANPFRFERGNRSVPQSSETPEFKKARKTGHIGVFDELPKFLSEAQIGAFFKAIDRLDKPSQVRDRALYRVMYHRGLRAAEMGLLEVSDWDSSDSTLIVRRLKGSRSGKYQLVDVEGKALRAWLRERGSAAGPIFPSRNHQPISRDMVRKRFLEYALAAGIERRLAHPHTLKHSCGTHVLKMVGSLEEVKDHLGHKSIQSTEIYAQILGVTRDKVASKLKGWK